MTKVIGSIIKTSQQHKKISEPAGFTGELYQNTRNNMYSSHTQLKAAVGEQPNPFNEANNKGKSALESMHTTSFQQILALFNV